MPPTCTYCDNDVPDWKPFYGGRPTCAEHCSASDNGAHDADMGTGTVTNGSYTESYAIVDFNCSHCGQSTGHRVEKAALAWS